MCVEKCLLSLKRRPCTAAPCATTPFPDQGRFVEHMLRASAWRTCAGVPARPAGGIHVLLPHLQQELFGPGRHGAAVECDGRGCARHAHAARVQGHAGVWMQLDAEEAGVCGPGWTRPCRKSTRACRCGGGGGGGGWRRWPWMHWRGPCVTRPCRLNEARCRFWGGWIWRGELGGDRGGVTGR